jgi:hypothetical protein
MSKYAQNFGSYRSSLKNIYFNVIIADLSGSAFYSIGVRPSPVDIVGSNPIEEWESLCFECCVLSGGGILDEMITRSEESDRLWCVAVCNLETS